MDFLLPPLDRRGAYVQLTSRGEPSLTARWLPAHVRDWTRKCRILRPGKSLEAARVSGSGIITRLFAAFPAFWKPSLYREIVLRLTWDDQLYPSVEVPIGDFFGIHHGRYRQYDSRLFSIISGGMTGHALMPFSKGFRLSFEQQGRVTVPLFFFGVGYYALDPADVSPLRFCASWRNEPLTQRGQPFTFVDVDLDAGDKPQSAPSADNRGYYVGMHLSTQNRHFWALDSPFKWMLPNGVGLGQLEGEEKIFIDGEQQSRHRGTGHEEYFNTGWYFRDGRYTGRDSGCLHRSYFTGRTGSYRWHWRDPIPFAKSIRGVMHHGIGDIIPAHYSATAFWYQPMPMRPLPVLPPVGERQKICVWNRRL